jgi:hypothetical protein
LKSSDALEVFAVDTQRRLDRIEGRLDRIEGRLSRVEVFAVDAQGRLKRIEGDLHLNRTSSQHKARQGVPTKRGTKS